MPPGVAVSLGSGEHRKEIDPFLQIKVVRVGGHKKSIKNIEDLYKILKISSLLRGRC